MDFKKIYEQAAALFKKLSGLQQAGLVALLLAVAGGATYLATREPEVMYGVLFSDLAEADAGGVVEELKTQKVPYRLRTTDDAVTVLVPASQADDLRLALSEKGLPDGGVGFGKMTETANLGITKRQESIQYNYLLSKELERTIKRIDAVKDARVHLAIPEKSVFRKLDTPPSASIQLELKKGHTMLERQVRGVVNLVAKSVQGLTPKAVTVVDEAGAELWSGDDDLLGTMTQRRVERERTTKIEALLERVLGPDQYLVEVTAAFERSRIRVHEVKHDTNPLVQSEQVSEEKTGPVIVNRQVAGARGNAPGAAVTPQAPPPNQPQLGRRSETKQYLHNTTSRDIEEPEIRLRRLHVAVMINQPDPVVTRPAPTSSVAGTSTVGGLYAVTEGPAPLKRGLGRPTPDIATLARLIRQAGGLDEARGDSLELATMPFYQPPEPPEPGPVAAEAPIAPPWHETMPLWAWALMAGSGLLLLVAMALLVVRKRREEAQEEADLVAFPARADEIEAVLEGTEYEPAPTLAELREKVHSLVQEDFTQAVEILTTWIDNEPATAGAEDE